MSYDLTEMLEFQRPAWSVFEEAFIDRYIRPLDPEEDQFGNLWLDVGDNPNVLWSSHTDTVHNRSGLQLVKVRKGVARLDHEGHKSDPKDRRPNCLGADCTTGVWLMTEMIREGVPGRYVFHRDEENGGNGSEFIATKNTELLEGIDMAIAFDRKGKNEVITHQGWNQRTCSDTFATELAGQLGMNFHKSKWGIFTDTKNYMYHVPECTNISVGYDHAHSANELQDLDFAKRLRDRLCQINTDNLPIKRDLNKVIDLSSYRKMSRYQELVYHNPRATAALLQTLMVSEAELEEWIDSYSMRHRQ